ncbi:MAG: helix-turn-helix domain-containing protein [Clostridia bacterium]|nr:helix-turn-helix domain-containing protein [Clostridia bacterium]
MPFIEFEKSVKDQDWSMLDLHSHKYYEIYFLSKGERTIFLADRLYEVSAPSLFIYPPSAVHKTEGGSFERHIINVSTNYLNEFQVSVLEEKKLKLLKLTENEGEKLLNLFETAYKIKDGDKYFDLKQNAVFSSVILEIERLGDLVQAPQTEFTKPIPSSILKILDYLTANCEKSFTLCEIANKFFISKTTLIYNFKKHVGRSPMDYLLAVRINKAKQMLVATKKSIGKIAEDCGFSSANYFGLIFKKREKVSPMQYRKLQNGKN